MAVAALMDERFLISSCQEGDREAFERLYEHHRARVFTIALYHLGGDVASAEDVTQCVFVKLFHTIGQFRHGSEFSTWLFRAVANACMDEHRRRRRWLPWSAVRDEPRASAGDYEMDEAVRGAVAKLSPKLRMTVLLKYFEDLSYEEIAEALGCSMGTVASRLNRSHAILAKHLGGIHG